MHWGAAGGSGVMNKSVAWPAGLPACLPPAQPCHPTSAPSSPPSLPACLPLQMCWWARTMATPPTRMEMQAWRFLSTPPSQTSTQVDGWLASGQAALSQAAAVQQSPHRGAQPLPPPPPKQLLSPLPLHCLPAGVYLMRYSRNTSAWAHAWAAYFNKCDSHDQVGADGGGCGMGCREARGWAPEGRGCAPLPPGLRTTHCTALHCTALHWLALAPTTPFFRRSAATA